MTVQCRPPAAGIIEPQLVLDIKNLKIVLTSKSPPTGKADGLTHENHGV